MLDPDARVPIPDAPLAMVYRDDRDAARFYAFAGHPRVALDDAGHPQLSVLVYRRGKENPPEGGQLTLTTSLALTAAEKLAVGRAAAAALAPPGRGPDPSRVPAALEARGAPTIVPPEWLSGEVSVHFADGIDMTGRPSLAGDNTCVLTAALDAAGAAAAERAVTGGLADTLASYAVEIAVGRSSRRRTETIREAPGRRFAYGLDVGITEAERQHLDLAGPLSIDLAGGADVLTTIGF